MNCVGAHKGVCNAQCKRLFVVDKPEQGLTGTCAQKDTYGAAGGGAAACAHGDNDCVIVTCVGGFTGECDASCKRPWVNTSEVQGMGTCPNANTVGVGVPCKHGEGKCVKP